MADAVGTVYLDSTKAHLSTDRRSFLRGTAQASSVVALSSVAIAEDPHVAMWREYQRLEGVANANRPEDECVEAGRAMEKLSWRMAETPAQSSEGRRALLQFLQFEMEEFGSAYGPQLRTVQTLLASM